MSQPASKSVIRREAEGIGRLHKLGFGPNNPMVEGLPFHGLPPRNPWSPLYCEFESELMTVAQLAEALCVRPNTIRDYLRAAGLEGISVSEQQRRLQGAVQAKKNGEISEDEYMDLVDDVLYAQFSGTPLEICSETLGIWVFKEGKHRLKHRWMWWWIEWVYFGTWTPEDGYIDAPPMTSKEWREFYPEVWVFKHK